MRLLSTIILFICLTPASAQIINGNFENWISFEGFLLLQGWEIYAYEEEPSVTRDFDAYEGLYAVQVTALDTGLGAYGRAGTYVDLDEVPPSLDFFVKADTEFGAVAVEIEFYNSTDTLDAFSWTSAEETMSNWTFVSIPLEPIDEVVTTARISITAVVGDFAPGTAIISVDQLSFGTVTNSTEETQRKPKIYPNPTANAIRIDESNELNRMTIADLSGKVVGSYPQPQGEIDLGHLPPACYVVSAWLKSGEVIRQKLIVE